jgi:hypothetical protein
MYLKDIGQPICATNPFADLVRAMIEHPVPAAQLDPVLPDSCIRLTQETTEKLQRLADLPVTTYQRSRLSPTIDALSLHILVDVVYPSLRDGDPYRLKSYMHNFIVGESLMPRSGQMVANCTHQTSDPAVAYFYRSAMLAFKSWMRLRSDDAGERHAESDAIRDALVGYSAGMAAEFCADNGGAKLSMVVAFAADILGVIQRHAEGTLSTATAALSDNATPVSTASVLTRLAGYMLDEDGLFPELGLDVISQSALDEAELLVSGSDPHTTVGSGFWIPPRLSTYRR